MEPSQDYEALVLHLPDPTGSMTMRQRIEVALFQGFIHPDVPANVSDLLHLSGGKTVKLPNLQFSNHFCYCVAIN